jgi:predicted alpha/beta-hydrolase family hydrolase
MKRGVCSITISTGVSSDEQPEATRKRQMTMKVERFRDEHSGKPTVSGFIHNPSAPSGDALILAHGAGTNCDYPLLVALAAAFCSSGMIVLRCDLPFRQERPKGRPLVQYAKRDQAGLKRAIDLVKASMSRTIYLGGHAYGGYQASILVASEPLLVKGLMLLSYPLHPPQQPTQLRISHLAAVRTRALFVQASRDPFGTHQEVRSVLALMPTETRLMSVEGARQELLTESNNAKLPRLIVREFKDFFGHTEC